MTVFQSRGVFWWAEDEIPPGAFAPPSAVPGLLTIEDDGRPKLDLDLLLNTSRTMKQGHESPKQQAILGLLHDSEKRVAVSGVEISTINYSSGGISYHKFRGWTCLVGKGPLIQSAEEASFSRMRMNCNAYMEWFELKVEATDRSRKHVSLSVVMPDDIITPVTCGTLTLEFMLSTSGFGQERSQFTVDRHVWLTYTPSSSVDWKVIQDRFAGIQEFLLMQTDALLDVGWPEVNLTGDDSHYTFYYPCTRPTDEAYSFRDRWIEFSAIKNNFGEALENFWGRRESAKSGYYMYTGLRRNPRTSVEHRFVSLVWGLEALHRRRFHPRVEERKILRAFDHMKLSYRLSEIIRSLPLNISESQLDEFCKRCAKVRNDISHWGMLGDQEDYNTSLGEVSELSEVLSFCYHIYVLIDSGASRSYLQSKMTIYMRVRHVEHLFHKYGLHPMTDEQSI